MRGSGDSWATFSLVFTRWGTPAPLSRESSRQLGGDERKRNFPRVAVSLAGNYQERTVITLSPPNHYVFTSSLPASRNTSMIIWN